MGEMVATWGLGAPPAEGCSLLSCKNRSPVLEDVVILPGKPEIQILCKISRVLKFGNTSKCLNALLGTASEGWDSALGKAAVCDFRPTLFLRSLPDLTS